MTAKYYSIKNQTNHFNMNAVVLDGLLLRSRFLSLLYHDKRGGQMLQLKKELGESRQYSTCDISDLMKTGTDTDVYTSVNVFKGNRRRKQDLFNVSAMYIDLDCHEYKDEDELEHIKKATADKLQKLWEDGTVPYPTMITDSGRGYGLFYVLKTSIANTEKTEKSMRYYSLIYERLMDTYVDQLSECQMHPDGKVTDVSRVCRLPGTVNSKNGRICSLVVEFRDQDERPLYHSLQDLADALKIPKAAPKSRQIKVKDDKIIYFTGKEKGFFAARIGRLQNLQDLRGERCEGYREQMCFIAYSALVQLYGAEIAPEKLYDFNNRFVDPLDEAELDHIIEGTDGNVAPDYSWSGYYKLPDRYIIRTLEVSEDEARVIGFDCSWRKIAQRVENQEKKKKRDETILEDLRAGLTYKEVAEKNDISIRTINRIVSKYDVCRYKKKAEIIQDTTVLSGKDKSAKNFQESDVVGHVTVSGDTLFSIFAAPAGYEKVFENLTPFGKYLYKLELKFGAFLVPELVSTAQKSVWSDERFDLIDSTPEYQYRLDSRVLSLVKTAFEQAQYLKKPYFLVNGRSIKTKEIKKCFKSMSYKDIVVICERMQHQGTIQHARKPFFYIMKTVWTYKHPEDGIQPLSAEEKKTKTVLEIPKKATGIDWEAIAISELINSRGKKTS